MRVLRTHVMAAEVTAELTTSPRGMEGFKRKTFERERVACR